MTQPTSKVRTQMYERDRYECAATGRADNLSHQHRRAVGMGGAKVRPSITDSLTLTREINDRCERDLQVMALAYGWKVRKWVKDPADVPVFYAVRGWYRLTEDGQVVGVSPDVAAQMMREVYGDEWDEWMREIGRGTPNGLAVAGRSEGNG